MAKGKAAILNRELKRPMNLNENDLTLQS